MQALNLKTYRPGKGKTISRMAGVSVFTLSIKKRLGNYCQSRSSGRWQKMGTISSILMYKLNQLHFIFSYSSLPKMLVCSAGSSCYIPQFMNTVFLVLWESTCESLSCYYEACPETARAEGRGQYGVRSARKVVSRTSLQSQRSQERCYSANNTLAKNLYCPKARMNCLSSNSDSISYPDSFIYFMSTLRSTRLSRSLRRQEMGHTDGPYHNILNAIKNCDTSIITGPQLNRLPKQDIKLPDIESYNSSALIEIRRKHDLERKQSILKEKDIAYKKDELEKLRKEEEELNGEMTKMNLQQFQQQLKENQTRLEQLEMQKKVLQTSIKNGKQDNVIYKNRLNILQKVVQKSKLGVKNQREILTVLVTKRNQSLKLYNILLAELAKLRNQRETQYQVKEGANQQLKILEESTIQRAAHLEEVAERVMDEKDSTQQQIQKLMLVQKFFEEMMRAKMERQMGRFKLIEQAFKNIKLTTGVSDTSQLVSKYLNKEAAYGELLFKIAENEKKIDLLRADNHSLVVQRKRLRADMTMFEPPHHSKVNMDEEAKQLSDVENQAKKIALIENKIKVWLYKSMSKLQITTGQQTPFQGTQQGLKHLLQTITKLSKQQQGKKVNLIVQSLDNKEYFERNVRISLQKDDENEQ